MPEVEIRRQLGYKNPAHTSQESHYVSVTEPSRLMLCKILGFHGGDYEECRFLVLYPRKRHFSEMFIFLSELCDIQDKL
jgi:hypothetical protein